MRAATLHNRLSIVIRPDSMRCRSKTSSTNRLNRSELLSAICAISPAFGGNGPVTPPTSKPSAPLIEARGVRNS